MKINRFAFNIVSLIVAGLFAVAAFGTVFAVLPGASLEHRGFWHLMAAIESIVAVTAGGGGIVNLVKGRLAPWPTGIMIVGYIITVWLLPLAIWGVISLVLEHKRHKKELEST